MIKIGIIGYGYWGPNIAKTINSMDGAKLESICDSNPLSLRFARTIYPLVKTFEAIEDFLDSDIEAVVVATPIKTHFEIASAVLKAGKHVIVEKPLTYRSSDIKKLDSISRKLGLVLMVGHTFEYNPSVVYVRDIVKKNLLGKIYYVYSTRVNLGQVRGDINALWNLAPHDFSILNFILSKKPIEISACGASYLQKNIDDLAFINIKYPGGIIGKVHVSWIDPSKIRQFTVVGSKKMLICNDIDTEMPIKIFDKGVETGKLATGVSGEFKMKLRSGDIFAPKIDTKEPLKIELEEFVSCVEKRRKPRTGSKNALLVVKMLEASQKSIINNSEWVKIN